MSDLLSPETRERRRNMLRTAMGPAIALALDEPDVVERSVLVERRPECVDDGIDRGVKTGARPRIPCRLAGEAHQSEGGHPEQDHKPRGRPLRVVALRCHFLRAISSTAFIQYAFDPM